MFENRSGLNVALSRRHALRACVGLAVALGIESPSAQPVGVARVGLLAPGSRGEDVEGFLAGMRELGYVEGRSLIVEYRSAGGDDRLLPALMADLIRLKVDVIVTGGAAAVLAAKRLTSTLPIVFGAMSDPVGTGVVSNLAHPDANVTGLSLGTGDEFGGKYLELLRELVPGATRVALLYHPVAHIEPDAVMRAAPRLGIVLQVLEVRDAQQLAGAFDAMTAGRAQGLIVGSDPFMFTYRSRIVALAGEHRLPAVYGLQPFVDAGGLMAYAPSLRERWHRAAAYVDRILKGAKPGDLPIEQPTTFELSIRLSAARALGLAIPPTLRLQATRIVE